jgi:hypothetical protein
MGQKFNDSNLARSNTQDPLFFWIQAPQISDPGSRQCCGSGMFIPDTNFFHPGSRVKKNPGSASNTVGILTQKIVSKLSKTCSSRIRILRFYPSRIPGLKRPWILICNTGSSHICDRLGTIFGLTILKFFVN